MVASGKKKKKKFFMENPALKHRLTKGNMFFIIFRDPSS